MKTTKFNIVLLLIFSLFVLSCSKEETDPNSTTNDPISCDFVLDNIPEISNPYNMVEYIANPNDADDEKISRNLLEVGISIREQLNNKSLNDLILKTAKLNPTNSMNLFELVLNPKFKSTKPEYSRLQTILGNADWTHKSTNQFKSTVVEEYIPVIYIPNIEIADMNKTPIICPAIQVNCELPGMEKYEDYIVGWYLNKDGKQKEILINEETAMSTTNPIFIIDIGEEEALNRSKSTNILSSPLNFKSTSELGDYYFHSNEFQINQRYETTGKSEFCISAGWVDEYGVARWILNQGADDWKLIRDVDKDDIGDPLEWWTSIVQLDVEPLVQNYVFWNTFERDWECSKKSLGMGSAPGSNIYLYGNMRYTGNWYTFEPNYGLSDKYMDLNYIYNYWAKWQYFESDKGNLRIWRVMP